MVGAELSIPEDFEYGKKTFASYGKFLYDDETAYKLQDDSPLHVNLSQRLGKSAKAKLWEAEISPKMVGGLVNLKKDTEVRILAETHYFYSLTSWRKPLPREPKEYSSNIFELNAFFIEVISEGEDKGKTGWLVNQMDRYLDETKNDPFGTWIPDRLGLDREADKKR